MTVTSAETCGQQSRTLNGMQALQHAAKTLQQQQQQHAKSISVATSRSQGKVTTLAFAQPQDPR